MSRVLRGARDFNPDNLTFSKINNFDQGVKVVYPLYDEIKDKVYIQTCENMSIPFGLNLFESKYGPKYALDISFQDYDKINSEMNRFYNNMEKLDQKILSCAIKNSIEWFGIQKTYKNLKQYYKPIIKKYDQNINKYPPKMRVKIPYSDGKFLCDFYSNSRQKIDFHTTPIDTLLNKNNKIKLLLQFVGLWFRELEFGSSWKVIQGEVDKSDSFANYCFIND